MKILDTIGYAIIVVSFIISCPAAHANSVKNKTYTVWVSSSFDESPFPHFRTAFNSPKTSFVSPDVQGNVGGCRKFRRWAYGKRAFPVADWTSVSRAHRSLSRRQA
ncbi:hypothetical protein [Defluviicoccus vanus]|uniref:Uncharacterized protein n=1 Tax=Defluviicoccus vanus TaxID=111831 RepID=A0A7H1N279_9PROT|nr:hypothetical protein [Defluviicoccus vanus]QNT69815.1 hypothetical protein HQ394_11440 [Defluviicoccus vanus]